MLEPTKTKFYSFEDVGAPTLTGNYLQLTNLFNKVLIEGFNERIPVSIVLEGNFLVITFQEENHGFKNYHVVSISGSSEPLYNREFRVNSVDKNTIKILVDDTFVNVPTNTGEIVIKCAPLGFIRKFSEEGKLVITSDTWSGCLRIEDWKHPDWNSTWAKYARLQIATDYIDINTAVGTTVTSNSAMLTPTLYDGQTYKYWVSYRMYLSRSSGGSDQTSAPATVNRSWYIAGDSKGFYFCNAVTNSSPLSSDDSHYYYVGNYTPLAHEATGFTQNSILLCASYNGSVTSTSKTEDSLNSLVRGTGGTYNGVIFNGYSSKNWFRLKPILSEGQVYSGTTTSTSVPTNSRDNLGYDILTPVYVEQVVSADNNSGYALVGLSRGIKSIATTVPVSTHVILKERSLGSLPAYFRSGRNKDYVYLDVIKDWE